MFKIWLKTSASFLPASLKSIAATAFRYAGLEGSLVIPEGCHTIGQYAFSECEIGNLILSNSLKNVDKNAFANFSPIVVKFKGTEEEWLELNSILGITNIIALYYI